jgi:uncharacterized membrane protein YadS
VPPKNSAAAAAPGLIGAAVAVAVAVFVHLLLPALPAMTLAVLLGLLAANLPGVARWTAGPARPGLDFAGKHLMRAGIVVLGLKVSLGDVLGLGWAGAAARDGRGAGRLRWHVWHQQALPASSPRSAAGGHRIRHLRCVRDRAMAAVRRIRQEETVLPVALVTLCGTLAIGVLPLLARPLGLGPELFGAWTGASVHDVGQVVATAQTAGATALAVAVVVKLTRVILLAPMVAVAGFHHRLGTTADGAKRPPVIPLFVIGFIALAALRTTGWLSPAILDAAAALQDALLGMALFGLGSAVRVGQLLHTGARALLAALASWLLIALLGLAAAYLMFPPA